MNRIVARADGPSIGDVTRARALLCNHPYFLAGMEPVWFRMSTDPPPERDEDDYFYADDFPENTVAKCDCGEYLVNRRSDMVIVGKAEWFPLRWYHFKAHSNLRRDMYMS